MSCLVLALSALLSTAPGAPADARTGSSLHTATAASPDDARQQQPDDHAEPPRTPQQEAAFAAGMRYRHGIEQSLRSSASPRDWALSTQMLQYDDPGSFSGAANPARTTLLRKAAEAAPKDRLVQWIWANVQPENSGCDAQHPCPDRQQALAALEPENGAAWIPVVNAAAKADDAAGVEKALARMSMATRYDETFGEAMIAWVDVYRRHPPSAEFLQQPQGSAPLDVDVVERGMAMAEVAGTLTPAYQSLVIACKREQQPNAGRSRFENCGNTGRLMLNHSTSLLGRMIGRALLRVSGTANAADIEAARTLAWQFEKYGQAMPQENDAAAWRAYLADLEHGEVEAVQNQLRRTGIPLTPPASWQPTRNGKPISPLGEPSAPAKQP